MICPLSVTNYRLYEMPKKEDGLDQGIFLCPRREVFVFSVNYLGRPPHIVEE